MTTEIRPRGINSTRGDTLALSTTLNAIGVRAANDGLPVSAAILQCAAAFSFHLNPVIRAVFKTQDDHATYTDYTTQATDRNTATLVTLSSQGTAAQGDYLYVGSNKPFGGIVVDVVAANGNAATIAVTYRKSDNTWANITPTDGTASGGASLAVDGGITWTVPTDWITYKLNDQTLYWVQIAFSAALDSSTTVAELALLNRDTNRIPWVANVPIILPLSNEVGAIEAILGSSTATLNIGWTYGGVPAHG